MVFYIMYYCVIVPPTPLPAFLIASCFYSSFKEIRSEFSNPLFLLGRSLNLCLVNLVVDSPSSASAAVALVKRNLIARECTLLGRTNWINKRV